MVSGRPSLSGRPSSQIHASCRAQGVYRVDRWIVLPQCWTQGTYVYMEWHCSCIYTAVTNRYLLNPKPSVPAHSLSSVMPCHTVCAYLRSAKWVCLQALVRCAQGHQRVHQWRQPKHSTTVRHTAQCKPGQPATSTHTYLHNRSAKDKTLSAQTQSNRPIGPANLT